MESWCWAWICTCLMLSSERLAFCFGRTCILGFLGRSLPICLRSLTISPALAFPYVSILSISHPGLFYRSFQSFPLSQRSLYIGFSSWIIRAFWCWFLSLLTFWTVRSTLICQKVVLFPEDYTCRCRTSFSSLILHFSMKVCCLWGFHFLAIQWFSWLQWRSFSQTSCHFLVV